MTKKYNYVDDFDKRYITTYTLKDGGKYMETSYNYPDLANYICPHCGTYPMKYRKVDLGEWDGWRTEFGCTVCMSRYEEGDRSLKPAPIIFTRRFAQTSTNAPCKNDCFFISDIYKSS